LECGSSAAAFPSSNLSPAVYSLLATHSSLFTTHSLWQTELSYGTVLRSLVSWLLEACGSCRELKNLEQS